MTNRTHATPITKRRRSSTAATTVRAIYRSVWSDGSGPIMVSRHSITSVLPCLQYSSVSLWRAGPRYYTGYVHMQLKKIDLLKLQAIEFRFFFVDERRCRKPLQLDVFRAADCARIFFHAESRARCPQRVSTNRPMEAPILSNSCMSVSFQTNVCALSVEPNFTRGAQSFCSMRLSIAILTGLLKQVISRHCHLAIG